MRCEYYRCLSRKPGRCEEGLTFIPFPKSDPAKCLRWLKLIGRDVDRPGYRGTRKAIQLEKITKPRTGANRSIYNIYICSKVCINKVTYVHHPFIFEIS